MRARIPVRRTALLAGIALGAAMPAQGWRTLEKVAIPKAVAAVISASLAR